MNSNVGNWEKIEFANVANFGDLYQNLAIFRYSHYLEQISKILKYGEIHRVIDGHIIKFEKSNEISRKKIHHLKDTVMVLVEVFPFNTIIPSLVLILIIKLICSSFFFISNETRSFIKYFRMYLESKI